MSRIFSTWILAAIRRNPQLTAAYREEKAGFELGSFRNFLLESGIHSNMTEPKRVSDLPPFSASVEPGSEAIPRVPSSRVNPMEHSHQSDAMGSTPHDDPEVVIDSKSTWLWAAEFDAFRPRLQKIVAFRLDPSVKQRIDPADVVQESYFEIARRIHEFNVDCQVPFFVWVRQRVLQTMIDMQRSHSREKRSVHRERHLPMPSMSQSTSLSMAAWLCDDNTSPSHAAMQVEEQERLKHALDAMNETDREILAMRHFEHLANSEVAQTLGISPTAASNRYVRAAARLAELLHPASRPSAS